MIYLLQLSKYQNFQIFHNNKKKKINICDNCIKILMLFDYS